MIPHLKSLHLAASSKSPLLCEVTGSHAWAPGQGHLRGLLCDLSVFICLPNRDTVPGPDDWSPVGRGAGGGCLKGQTPQGPGREGEGDPGKEMENKWMEPLSSPKDFEGTTPEPLSKLQELP